MKIVDTKKVIEFTEAEAEDLTAVIHEIAATFDLSKLKHNTAWMTMRNLYLHLGGDPNE